MGPCCLVLYLESDEVGTMMRIPEACADIARRQGWHVLGRDSEIVPPVSELPANVQSNPVRYEGPPDYGEAE
jgi:hypothetical protein